MKNLRIILYHNSFYSSYKEESYFAYSNKGLFLIFKSDNLLRSVYFPSFDLNYDNIDSFMECREFKKAYERLEDGTFKWHNGYESKKEEIKRVMSIYYKDLMNNHKYNLL